MQLIITIGVIFLIACMAVVLIFYPNLRCTSTKPMGLLSFMSVLFTSGLDMGLIILPLTEFSQYSVDKDFSFTNPLAIEFGFWGFYIWSYYFITCFYFCVLEPKLRFFEIPLIKFIHNAIIILTCAFTSYLFLVNVDWYMPQLKGTFEYALLIFIVVFCVFSSTKSSLVKILSLVSSFSFFILAILMGINTKAGLSEIIASASHLTGYFTHLHHFILPINDHHTFYISWWFSWAVMIGHFISQFTSNLRAYQLFFVILIVPSIPLAIWFTILYHHYLHSIPIINSLKFLMLVLGVMFVINSVDSLIRLYSDNLGLTISKLGKRNYYFLHIFLNISIVLAFRFTSLQIQWVGSMVVLLFLILLLGILLKKYKFFHWQNWYSKTYPYK